MNDHMQNQGFQTIAQRLMPGSSLVKTMMLEGGISSHMTLIEIQTTNGDLQQVIVRQPGQKAMQENPHAASNEFKILELLHTSGLPVPEPYHFIPSGDIFPTPAEIIEYIPGKLDFSPLDVKSCIHQMASSLARIHSMEISAPEYSFLPRHSIDCLEMVARNIKINDYAIDVTRAYEKLSSGTVAAHHGPSCLLHGDFWPGNLLFSDDGSLTGVVDWEDACLGDPLSDLSISRLDICCIFGADAMHLFTQNYLSQMDIDITELPYWDLCAVMRLARLIGSDLTDWTVYYHRLGRQDITGESIKESCRIFIDQTLTKLI